jgi:branched-chain amino acid transport system ATP-binding protein
MTMSEDREFLLRVENLSVAYNGIFALRNVSLAVRKGEVVSVLGPNGAGKTTLLRTICGLVHPEKGSRVFFNNFDITKSAAYKIVRTGISHVPEGRQVFPDMTVDENLEIAGCRLSGKERQPGIKRVYGLFPELVKRQFNKAGSLSGGEQQMLAIGRAIVSNCEIVLIDEPSMGLAPVIVQRIFRTLREIVKQSGLTLLIVEQNAKLSLPLSDRIYILSQGSIALEGTVDELRENTMIQEMYFSKK